MRLNYCIDISKIEVGTEVKLSGWVQRCRDHGGVLFIDLRDATGIAQLVFNQENSKLLAQAENLPNESVITVTGEVCTRLENTANSNLATGEVEVLVLALEIHNLAAPLPFQLEDNVSDEVGMRYRYLDIRKGKLIENLQMRHKIIKFIRSYFDAHGFIDVETPVLTKSTPEGARDYLVPSRTNTGNFFALPQSPQLFKQLLMISGLEKYYQIARCFRDEDLRADRQPEFTQLDVEASFVSQKQVMELIETMIKSLFSELLGVTFTEDLPIMSYSEAVQKYGTDRPDLRIPLELVDVDELLQDTEFKVFANAAKDENSRVVALLVADGGDLTRKEIDEYTNFVAKYGAKGLAYIKVNDINKGIEGLQSPIVKFFPNQAVEIVKKVGAKNNDLIFFGADKISIVNSAMSALISKLGHDKNLYTREWQFLWITDFPMFEYDEKTGSKKAMHHPFSKPKISEHTYDELMALPESPKGLLSNSYDLVLNGIEIGGGSERIHDYNMQTKVLEWLGMNKSAQEAQFGFFLEALKYGCPPHAGIALGLDRLAMMMLKLNSIRDVIAFPKTQTATCLLTSAPSPVAYNQLQELGIELKQEEDDS